MEEKLLTAREASLILGISEKEVLDLTERGVIPAYKVGGVYLRFKAEQIEEFKKQNLSALERPQEKISLRERIRDFLYFNDFYIFSAIIISLLLFIILKS